MEGCDSPYCYASTLATNPPWDRVNWTYYRSQTYCTKSQRRAFAIMAKLHIVLVYLHRIEASLFRRRYNSNGFPPFVGTIDEIFFFNSSQQDPFRFAAAFLANERSFPLCWCAERTKPWSEGGHDVAARWVILAWQWRWRGFQGRLKDAPPKIFQRHTSTFLRLEIYVSKRR